MADFLRVQVIKKPANGLARDDVVNTLHFERGEVSSTTFQDIANDVRDRFAAYPVFNRGIKTIETRVYDLEDAPGPPGAIAIGTITEFALQAPREVALCLSFRAGENAPKNRGRIYLGPINAGSMKPDGGLRGDALALAQDLANIGGTDVMWSVFSPTTMQTGGTLSDAFKKVSYAWVDDEWDTVRSRGWKPTTRSELSVEG